MTTAPFARQLRDLILQARCQRCLGSGEIGHAYVGRDPCPVCDGSGVRAGRTIMRAAQEACQLLREHEGIDLDVWRAEIAAKEGG